ncbi:HSP20-like chaperone [Leucosporidium creatinivorum]|uniref:HSP20-like chaperone n=1 Tax=Leucosporidium creatinivorum TaxID=106004 RepID=A0A1Y2ENU4_9BASI|nr:HSP20-like chaperone [Leucosporidium creatinivorum]
MRCRFEKEGKVICTFELPGLTKRDVDVALHENILSISGTTAPLKQFTDDCTHVQRERSYSSFSRNLRVPSGLKDKEIKAAMENGVLRVEFPAKPEEVPGKKIEIA